MKFSAQEELGLRCLLQVAKRTTSNGITIHEISELEQLSSPNVAKLLRILRIGGFIESTRGQVGGYTLSRPASEIKVSEVLETLGGKLWESGFCEKYSAGTDLCSHTIDCSIKSLWQKVQFAVDQVLLNVTLADLMGEGQLMFVEQKMHVHSVSTTSH